MKKLIILTFLLLNVASFAQSTLQAPLQNISVDNNVVYRLFSTQNMYNFIKLNTRNGQMWQVQWDTKTNQLETPISLIGLISIEDEQNGRFFLYPTKNMFNFILVDQIDGRIWQVQWSFNIDERMVLPIKSIY